MRKLIGLVIVLLFTSVNIAYGQTVVTKGPIDTTNKLSWELPINVTLADAPTFEYRLRDSLSTTPFVLTNVLCPTALTCTASVTQSIVDQVNKLGAHSLTLTMFRADVGESSASIPFLLTTSAAAPTGLKIIK